MEKIQRLQSKISTEVSVYILTINHTVDYMARGFMIFMRGIDITRVIGRVLLKVEPVLGPETSTLFSFG